MGKSMNPGLMPERVAYRLPDEELDRFLREDCPYGDLTTALLQIGTRPGRMVFTTRNDTVVCCTEEAARLLERLGCTVTAVEPSGTLLAPGQAILEVHGQAGPLHMGWKAALNLLEAASGIATRTYSLVREARAANPAIEVVATRKVFPGTKAVATKAVYAGGGLPHRLGLSESVLVFAQHVAFLDSSQELWDLLPQIKQRSREKKIAVEVTDQGAALAAALGEADIVQVDKMTSEELRVLAQLLRETAPKMLIAAAGGITEANAREYAATGVDLLVTSAMYWGKPADIAVIWRRRTRWRRQSGPAGNARGRRSSSRALGRPHLDELRGYADGDLLRRLSADGEADGGVYPGEILGREPLSCCSAWSVLATFVLLPIMPT